MVSGQGVSRGEPLLRLSEVSRDYGDHRVLHAVSLTVTPGECTVVMGENGSGKSTLLRVASGREEPSAGAALFEGRPLDEDSVEARTRIATVMDAGAHYPDLTVYEHLMLVALSHGLGAAADEAVAGALEEFRLDRHAQALPATLSSGQGQALLLAAAFVRPHDLLLLDEPEQRLDAHAREELAERLAAHRDAGTAILLATHHRALSAVADRLLVLEGGSPVPAPPGNSR